MSVAWVAAGVRARAMTRRRLGRSAARDLATSPSLAAAVDGLVRSPYGHDVKPGDDLAGAQHAVVATALWNLRVLAGWLPREGVAMLRVLSGVLEIANVDEHLRRFAGGDVPPPYRLGGLGTAWSRLTETTNATEVRRVLAASPWGDPGGQNPREIGLAMRVSLADRVMAAAPAAAAWAAGASALLIARESLLQHRQLPPRVRTTAAKVIGAGAAAASTLPEYVKALPASARWALTDVAQPTDLWNAEARWWDRVEHDGHALIRRVTPGPESLVGAAALLAADAWRIRAALEVAARGGDRSEALDAGGVL